MASFHPRTVVTTSHESEERDSTIYSPLYKTKVSGWSHTDSVWAVVFDQGEGSDILDAIIAGVPAGHAGRRGLLS
jgi:hypothetical protein